MCACTHNAICTATMLRVLLGPWLVGAGSIIHREYHMRLIMNIILNMHRIMFLIIVAILPKKTLVWKSAKIDVKTPPNIFNLLFADFDRSEAGCVCGCGGWALIHKHCYLSIPEGQEANSWGCEVERREEGEGPVWEVFYLQTHMTF